ncbi:uncharacterized protein EKO05_0008715 [Ascochyta rabiei]|uniref:Uncharacterized protein n=1 Tax=Didymella rabiei TaxID=5454 RepID=A0A163G209_DIDRA|nr:uncharacterized protein EKO05_0008715 [Ascochyta rabiei]KZM24642.1 hypothetical protein ST47_g4212 [Ascochyta rabiei]UPX18414.1 hypothetical protein EKO05_0008715 [Ascochyta rabiei]
MEPHTLPTDTGPNDAVPDMRAGDSLFGPYDSEPDQPTEIPEPARSTSVEHTTHTTPATGPHAVTETPPETEPEEKSSLPVDDQTLYDAYHASYAHPISETSAHMQHAKALAHALLQRHYPESQDYLVEPAALGPFSDYGINFRLKKSDEPDSDPDTPPLKKPKRPTKATTIHCSYEAPWHSIGLHNMAAFVVKQRVKGVGTSEYRTHTGLVVMLDDLATFYRWSRDNEIVRGDVLSDLLGVIGRVDQGHGMLFFGPRLELYQYDASDDKTPVKPHQHPNWRMDMRTTSLAAVDKVLSSFAAQAVVHQEAV